MPKTCGKPECVATDERRTATLRGMRRDDGEDHSTIYCACGKSFAWSSADDGLNPFLDAHAEHLVA